MEVNRRDQRQEEVGGYSCSWSAAVFFFLVFRLATVSLSAGRSVSPTDETMAGWSVGLTKPRGYQVSYGIICYPLYVAAAAVELLSLMYVLRTCTKSPLILVFSMMW